MCKCCVVFVERKKSTQLIEYVTTHLLTHIHSHCTQQQIPLLQVLKPFAPITPSFIFCVDAQISITPQQTVKWTHQQLWSSQNIQVQTLDPGVVDPHLPVDPWALDTDQDPKVSGEPGGSWWDETEVG